MSAFFENVRSGKNLQAAYEFMREQVIAHQVQSENEYTIIRSPKDYIEHVEEMQELYGQFELIIQEIVADENKVYVRWKQIGQTDKNKTIIQIASAVYLVERGKIAEYWIQIDRKGIENQYQ
ncbi:ester cyclase [Enterococcus rotai]|uniref:ester cyclase n=1 Tax=Enterococcus rotai TaxID=118060 RepID=UPI0032B58997